MTAAADDDSTTDSGRILIPDTDEGFSVRKLWAFTGPGLLLCVAYLDPGNIEADLQAGVSAKYKILWILLTSTVFALLMQRLSLRLGVVTGHHLAEMCYLQYPAVPRLFLWLMIEIAIIGSDMQEVIGTAVALYLLTNKFIPLWLGVVLTVVDTFMFLLLDRYGLRKLEVFFALLVAIMAFSFGYQFVAVVPGAEGGQLVSGLVTPWCQDCDSSVLLQAIGIIGSTIMPHNLYLHSGLVKSRAVDRSKVVKVCEATRYFFAESLVGLTVSLIINIMIVAVFAHGLYGKTNADVMNVCLESGIQYDNVFPNNTEPVELDIYSSGVFLGCRYGVVALYVWGVGVLAAGEGTTMTGCYAGQLAMEGFLQLRWSKWKRVLFTRTVAVAPTLAVASLSSLSALSGMNDLLNAVMSVQIPFAALPLVAFTSSPRLMGRFANGKSTKAVTVAVSVLVIVINVCFVCSTVVGPAGRDSRLLVALVAYSVLYAVMCLYLLLHMAANMTSRDSVLARALLRQPQWTNKEVDLWSCPDVTVTKR